MIPLNKKINTLENKLNKNQVEYNLNDTKGWRRIAKIGNSISKFYIIFNGYGYCCLSLNIANAKGWSIRLEKGQYRYTNAINRFSKARIVYKGNADCYLEVYNNYESSTLGTITITIDNNKDISLLEKETIVSDELPNGYNAEELALA